MGNNDGSLVLTTYIDDSGIDEGLDNIEKKGVRGTNRLSKMLNMLKKGTTGLIRSISSLAGRIVRVIGSIGGIGLAFTGIIATLAVVGVAISKAFQTDEVKANIAYIKYLFQQAIQPLVNSIAKIIIKITEWVIKLLGLLNAISILLFNYNLFQNASLDGFKKQNKEAQKLKRTLAGFDEMNVLSDGGSSTQSDDIDTSKVSAGMFNLEEETQKAMGWLEELKKIIVAITGALIIMKLTGLDPIMSLGIGLAISGIIFLIKDIIDMFKDPSWEKFGDIMLDLTMILGGVALAFLAINLTNPVGWILLAIALVTALTALIIKNWDKIKGTFQKVKTWIEEKFIVPIKSKFNSLPKWAQNLIKGIGNIFIGVLNSIITAINAFLLPFSAIISGIGAIIGKSWKWNFLQIPKIPKLAKGGIINLPNRGVSLGGAIAGESGREGVIPLTDSQQMELLGEAIGKYITINANITNSMNGRVLSREIQKIQNQSSFATNR